MYGKIDKKNRMPDIVKIARLMHDFYNLDIDFEIPVGDVIFWE